MDDSTIPPLTVPQPPVTGRTNLATVTYPVILATDTQRGVATEHDHMLWNVPSPKPVIDQFAILLTRKNLPLRQGSKHLPVFSRLNNMKCANTSGNRKKMRTALQKELKFAGIAFTGVEEGFGDGAPRMIASVIGGSHTVMSFNHKHSSTPLRPGATVRWTLPRMPADGNVVTHPPVLYHGASGSGVFAELEEVTPESTLKAIEENLEAADENEWNKLKANIIGCPCDLTGRPLTGVKPCNHFTGAVKFLLDQIQAVNEREIGVVIQDNGKGSIDIRLK